MIKVCGAITCFLPLETYSTLEALEGIREGIRRQVSAFLLTFFFF